VSEFAKEIKIDPVSVDGLETIFDVSGTDGTEETIHTGTSGTSKSVNPGQPGQETIDATNVSTFISTSEAAKVAGVDSRTIRRWHEQKKVRGQFTKGKLLIALEDLTNSFDEPDRFTAGTSGTHEQTAGTPENSDPGQPGQSADIPQAPALVFSDVFDRIERLSRENGELRVLLDEQRRENQELRLLTDSQQQRGFMRFWSWFTGR